MRRVFGSASAGAYALTLLFVAVATVGLIFLQNELPGSLNLPIVVIAYLLSINVATQMAGFAAGVVAAIASFLCLNFFFIDPRGTLLVSNATDLIVLALFLIAALINNQLLGRAQRRTIEAAQREYDATRFYELSLGLISAADAHDIAAMLSSRLHDILGAQTVEVALKPLGQDAAIHAIAPPQTIPKEPATRTESVASARANFGVISIWRIGAPLSLGEERLVRTFAGEAALILERMRMSSVETRAKVLEESDHLKTALLGSVSHELRTPLATIRAGVESLRSGLIVPDSAAGQEMLDDVSEASDHLSRLVNNMLDMSKIESGALKPEREWTDLAEIINSVAARLHNELGQHSLGISVPDDLPLAPADPVQLDQVFTNLITNSVKYAPPGTAIHIGAIVQGDQTMLVQVSNESPCLPPEELERIFDKFHRVTQADRVVGIGLGLSICKGIIEAHGGRMWAANRHNDTRGFIFNFTLPLTWHGVAPKMPPPEALENGT